MRLILKTSSNYEHSDGCEFAIFTMTPELARYLLGLRDTFRALAGTDRGLSEIVLHSLEAEYMNWIEDEDLQERFDGGEDYIEAPEGFSPEICRTEYDRLVIEHGYFYFQSHPKHCDWMVETAPLDWAFVEKFLDPKVGA